ncbi:MAG: hypothetical protein WC933_02750 [Candidatus Paceibacterota bacterium]|jgi:hypothetical protein
MEKTIEIARSFSWTVQVEAFAPRNFFCSEKMECLESEAEETSKKLFHFCRQQVEKDVAEYIIKHSPEIIDAEVNLRGLSTEPITEEMESIKDKLGL